ncbi:MAG: YeeE/YedE family protein [Deltaproteobacteria bacterium]|nr:YeeE/YedE family protein [Deltaproteobacteria bacterium]
MENFTPIASTIGGALIGLSAAMMMLFHGRIAGISGIVSGLLGPRPGEVAWRLAFFVGLLAGGLVLGFALPDFFSVEVTRSPLAIVAAGVIVGFGTRLGSGCTSGHGVCGISRFSRRSILATLTFMGTGAITAAVVTQLFGGVI